MEKTKRLNYFSDYAICSDYDTKAGVARVYSQSKPQWPFLEPAQQVKTSLSLTQQNKRLFSEDVELRNFWNPEPQDNWKEGIQLSVKVVRKRSSCLTSSVVQHGYPMPKKTAGYLFYLRSTNRQPCCYRANACTPLPLPMLKRHSNMWWYVFGVFERWEEWDKITLVLTKRIIIFPTQSRDCFLSCEDVQIPLKNLICCHPDSRILDPQMGRIKYLLIISHTSSVLLE